MGAGDALVGGAQRPFSLPRDAVEILLVRHGTSARGGEPGSRQLRDGASDPPLNDGGHAQAERLAPRLAAIGASRVFVSSLRRTAQTAEPLLRRTGDTATVVDDLREVYLGVLDGEKFELERAAGSPVVEDVFRHQRWDVIPEAESAESFSTRVRRGLDAVADATPHGAASIAFVHAAVIAELLAQITGSRALAFIGVENASISTVIRSGSGHWMLRSFNDTAHLSA